MLKQKLGVRIASLRRSKGLSQEELAEQSSYSTEFISLVERGIHGPSISGLERIAKALNIELKLLFDFNDSSFDEIELLPPGRPRKVKNNPIQAAKKAGGRPKKNQIGSIIK